MIYLICFGISTLFAHQAKLARKRSSFIAWSVLSILVTVLLAGLRGISVGIDTKNYYYGSWSSAVLAAEKPIREYVTYFLTLSRERFEVLFGLLTGIVAKTTGNYQIQLFCIHLIIVACVYIGAFRMKDYADPEFTLLLFYLLYYNHSLNISRQYIAMAILFAAVKDLEEGKNLRYLLALIIAFMFHNTAVIGLTPMLVHQVIYPKKVRQNTSNTRKIVACILILGGTFAVVPFAMLLINSGILSRKYLYYFNGEAVSTYKLVMLFLVVEGIAIVLFWKSFRKNGIHADYFLICSFSFFVLYIFAATQINYGKRIAAYFSFLNIISLGMLVKCPALETNRKFMKFMVILTVLVYWLYAYAYRNASLTFPYVLGI